MKSHYGKRQTSNTLTNLQSWSKIQTQIRTRRLAIVEESGIKQNKLKNQLRHDGKVEWSGSSYTMVEALSQIKKTKEASLKRDVPFLSRRTLIIRSGSNGDHLLWLDTFWFSHPPVVDSLSDHPRLLTSPGTLEYDKDKDFPYKFFLFCKDEPRKWAKIPVLLSHIIYERIKERHSDFDARLQEHGLTDIKVAGEEDDPSSFTVSSWKSAYKTDNKNVADQM
nr:clavaminate synthase-like protein At3g21360 [Tanacetum cinerariifolium]